MGALTTLAPAQPARTIWERRAEVGLEAPDGQLRANVWGGIRILDIGGGAHGYDPWPSFAKAHHSAASFVLCSGAERVGKSIATAMEGMAWLPVSQLIWIAGPRYSDTLKEFDYMSAACLAAGVTAKRLIKRSQNGPSLIMTRDGRRIETRSLYDIEVSLVSEAPDIVLTFLPAEHLPVRVRLLLGEMFDDRA